MVCPAKQNCIIIFLIKLLYIINLSIDSMNIYALKGQFEM